MPATHYPYIPWLSTLRQPRVMPWAVAIAVILVSFCGVYYPFAEYARGLELQLTKEARRNELASALILLREKMAEVNPSIPVESNDTQWRQYILSLLRISPLTVISVEPGKVERLGPYRLLSVGVALEGQYEDFNDLLEHIETDDRLLRIDHLSIMPSRNESGAFMFRITLSGIVG